MLLLHLLYIQDLGQQSLEILSKKTLARQTKLLAFCQILLKKNIKY